MKLTNYNGNVEMIAGLKQVNDADFPLMEANAIQTREDGTRLDEELNSIHNQLNAVSEGNTIAITDDETGVTYELHVINGKLTLIQQGG